MKLKLALAALALSTSFAQAQTIVEIAAGDQRLDGTGQMANVIIADIVADNGVIHVIDKVLIPGTRPARHQANTPCPLARRRGTRWNGGGQSRHFDQALLPVLTTL